MRSVLYCLILLCPLPVVAAPHYPGIEFHDKDRVDDPARELKQPIYAFAVAAYGNPKSCSVKWSQEDGVWNYALTVQFHGARFTAAYGYESHRVDLVADHALKRAAAAQRVLDAELGDMANDQTKQEHSSRVDKQGIRWENVTDENRTRSLGYRGRTLVGIRAEDGS